MTVSPCREVRPLRLVLGVSVRAIRSAAVAALMAACFLSAASPAAATVLVRTSIEQATADATSVFVGRVVGTRVEETPEGVRTAVRLWVEEPLKGAARGVVTVYVPGGTLPDGSAVTVESMASFSPGELCCVFADARGWVVGGHQGKLALEPGGVGVRSQSEVAERVRRSLSNPGASEAPPTGAVAPTPAMAIEMLATGPRVDAVTPGRASAGTRSSVTISGAGFGSSPGKVEFALNVYGVARIASDYISSWTDSRIDCEVPVGSVGGMSASAGSGPLVVTDSAGAQSAPYRFEVPFGYSGKRWPSSSPVYLVNAGGADAARREQLADAGAATWNAARSGFTFVDGGSTGLGAAQDGSNVLSWSGTVPAGVVALTRTYSDPAGQITECDIQFNNAIEWTDGLSPNATDIQSIALHELGHWLCLLDQYPDADVDKIMYGYLLPGQNRVLSAGDVAGIRWVYPAPSGSLGGTVRDVGGAPLGGSAIVVDSCLPISTAPDGSFEVTGVPAGDYQVACLHQGHTTQVFSATIVAEEKTQVDIVLAAGQPMPVYRFYHRKNGSHFYTASVAERDRVIAKLPRTYAYEGVAYSVNVADPANSAPLYRFFNKKNGSHFYTASAEERDRVRATSSRTYAYEGVAYYVATAPSVASMPIYRFFNKRNRSHFYTASTAEKNLVIRDLGATYSYEGTAFWATP